MTREDDLVRIAKKLDKMVSRNNTDGAMDLLKELQNFNMTLRLLQDTRIGMSVNGIRKHCTNEEVVALAKILIKSWKRLLESAQNEKADKPGDVRNGTESTRPAVGLDRSSSEEETSHRPAGLVSNSRPDLDPLKKHAPDKPKREDEQKKVKFPSDLENRAGHPETPRKEAERKDALTKNGSLHPTPNISTRPSLPPNQPPPAQNRRLEMMRESQMLMDELFPPPPPIHIPRRPSADSRRNRKISTECTSAQNNAQASKKPLVDLKKDRHANEKASESLHSSPPASSHHHAPHARRTSSDGKKERSDSSSLCSYP